MDTRRDSSLTLLVTALLAVLFSAGQLNLTPFFFCESSNYRIA